MSVMMTTTTTRINASNSSSRIFLLLLLLATTTSDAFCRSWPPATATTNPPSSDVFPAMTKKKKSGPSARRFGSATHKRSATSTTTASIDDKTQDCLISLSSPHQQQTPAEVLHELAEYCHHHNIDTLDVYGDYDETSETSFLRRFEKEIVEAFTATSTTSTAGKEVVIEDAVFMPSGVMAQSIALLIHRDERRMVHNNKEGNDNRKVARFACHETCHILLHEQDAYRELLAMDAVVISTRNSRRGVSIPPMMFADVEKVLSLDDDRQNEEVSTLIIEIPHRELGGKLTPWDDLERMSKYCKDHGIAFHCDGARLFEATAGYPTKSLSDFAALFDSIYISFYKGLGGVSGAMLLGSKDFCKQARVWLRRFGGNLYTLMPYAVSGWAGYRRQWCLQSSPSLLDDDNDNEEHLLSFEEKTERLKSIINSLSTDKTISSVVTFDLSEPDTCMVHGYLRDSLDVCQQALDAVQERCGIQVLKRVRPVPKDSVPCREGYRSTFELVIGENNGKYPQETFLKGWSEFTTELLQSRESS